MIKDIFIDAIITTPKTGRVVIVDDPSQYDRYKALGFHYIFEDSKEVKETPIEKPESLEEPKRMSFPLTTSEKLANKTKKELIEIAEEKGLDVVINMPKKAIIDLINDSDLS